MTITIQCSCVHLADLGKKKPAQNKATYYENGAMMNVLKQLKRNLSALHVVLNIPPWYAHL